jgi:hypothetical protein
MITTDARRRGPVRELPCECIREKVRVVYLNAFDTEIDFPGTACGSVSRAADSLKAALAPVLAGQGAPAILVDTGSVVLEPGVYPTGIDQLRRISNTTGLFIFSIRRNSIRLSGPLASNRGAAMRASRL